MLGLNLTSQDPDSPEPRNEKKPISICGTIALMAIWNMNPTDRRIMLDKKSLLSILNQDRQCIEE